MFTARQQPEHTVFQKAFSAIDYVHTVSQIIEKYNKYKKTFFVGLIDYNEAFDSIKHNHLLEVLDSQGTHPSCVYINLIEDICIYRCKGQNEVRCNRQLL